MCGPTIRTMENDQQEIKVLERILGENYMEHERMKLEIYQCVHCLKKFDDKKELIECLHKHIEDNTKKKLSLNINEETL